MTQTAFDEAKRVFETHCTTGTLTTAVTALARAGLSTPAIRGWALKAVREYGLALDTDSFDRAFTRGIRAAAPPAPEEAQPDEPFAIDVRPPARTTIELSTPAAAIFRDADHALDVALDARGTKSRLKQLKAAVTEATTARAAVSSDLAAFDAHVTKKQAEIEARAAAVRKREIAVFTAEARLKDERARLGAQQVEIDQRNGRYVKIGSGLTQEFSDRH